MDIAADAGDLLFSGMPSPSDSHPVQAGRPFPEWRVRLLLVLASSLIGAALFLGGLEFYLRLSGYEPLHIALPGETRPQKKTWAEPHPVFGWTYTPSAVITHKNSEEGFEIPYTINAEGFRESKPFDRPKTVKRVLVAGDSMAFGFSVLENERFTNAAERELGAGYEIYNISVPGWGIDQIYLALEHYFPVLDPDLVVIAFIEDDIFRTLTAYRIWEYRYKPLFELRRGRLVERTDGPRFVERLTRKSMAVNFLYHRWYVPHAAARLSRAFAERMAALTAARDIPIVFFQIPQRHAAKPGLNRRKRLREERASLLLDYLKKKNYTTVHALDPLVKAYEEGPPPFYQNKDYHPNAEGHRVLARELVKIVRESLG